MRIIAGPPTTGDNFYEGRLQVIELLGKKLDENNDVLIIGPRRTGKTSAIKEYLRQSHEKDTAFCSIYIDLEKIQSLYEFYFSVIRAIYSERKKYKLFIDDGINIVKNLNNYLSEVFGDGLDAGTLLDPVLGTSLKIKIPKFNLEEDSKKLQSLSKQLSGLLGSLTKDVVIVLDEFPELIWKLGKGEPKETQKESRKSQAQLLLEGLRAVRQEKDNRKHKVIIAGSVNLQNTLTYLQLEQYINDLSDIEIPYLTARDAQDLLSQLVATNDFTIQTPEFFKGFIEKQFGQCSPYYIQIYAEHMQQLVLNRSGNNVFTNSDIELCYKNTISSEKGPKYFRDRIRKYYEADEEIVKKILYHLANHQFSTGEPMKENKLQEEIFNEFKSLTRSNFTEIIEQMHSDDFIQYLKGGGFLGYESQFICNYWNYSFVNTRFISQ